MNKILLVDDEILITDINMRCLQKDNFEVHVANSGTEAIRKYQMLKNIDLIITDIVMPNTDGYELIDRILEINPKQAFVFISSKSSEKDKIYSLSIGAEDYVVKPFNPRELSLRVRNILKRMQFLTETSDKFYKIGNLELDTDQYIASVDGHKLSLTLKEFTLLTLLVRSRSKLLLKAEIYAKIWHDNSIADDNTLNVHIHELRRKIKRWSNAETPVIETVRGLGYRLK